MTYQQPDFTLPSAFLEQIAAQGFDALPELIRLVINPAKYGWAYTARPCAWNANSI